MGLMIGIDSRRMEFQEESIVIGRSPSARLSLPDTRLADQHAILRLVAGRWLIEAQGDGVIRVGDGRPTKVAWLNPGDVIHLTETGPSLTFAPTASTVAAAPLAAAVVAPPIPVPAAITPPAVPVASAEVPRAPTVLPPITRPPPGHASSVKIPPALQMAGVAIAIVLGLVVLVNQMSRPATVSLPGVHGTNQPVANRTNPVALQGGNAEPAVTQTVQPTAPTKVPAASTPEQLAAAVHLVLVSAPDRDQTYRLGAAFAIDKRRLVTCGAVGQGIQQLREQLPMTTVQGVGKSPAAEITEVLVHPDYVRLAQVAAMAQSELDDLRVSLEDAQDDKAAEAARPKMIAAQDRLLDALQQQLDVDLALLEVNRDLPQVLRVAKDDSSSLRPGSSVRLIGFPFPIEDFLVDPSAALTTTAVAGQVQAKVPAAGQDVRRWLVKFREAKPEDNWSGSPVVNSHGDVIGVYSRPTPPVELREDYVPATHEITVIARLAEIAGKKP